MITFMGVAYAHHYWFVPLAVVNFNHVTKLGYGETETVKTKEVFIFGFRIAVFSRTL